MKVLFELMIKIVLMVGLGILLKKKEVVTDSLQKGLSSLLVTAVLPLNIIASANQELTRRSIHGVLITSVFSFLYYLASIIILTFIARRISTSKEKRNLIVTMGAFANTGFMGFPLAEEMFGSSSIIYAVIYNLFYQLFFYTYGMCLISRKSMAGFSGVKSLLKMPVTIASFLSVLIFVFQIALPSPVQGAFETVGSMTVPLSMIIIGCMISEIKLKAVLEDKLSYLVTVFRLVIFPLTAFFILKALRVDALIAGICVLITGLPSGSLNVIMAEQEDCDPEFAAKTVVQTMIFMIVSLPVLFLLIGRL